MKKHVRFSKRKILGKIEYFDFITEAIKLNSLISGHFPQIYGKVELFFLYEKYPEEISSRKNDIPDRRVDLDEFTQYSFNDSRNVSFNLYDGQRKDYMVSLIYNNRYPKDLVFSGENLEQFSLDILESFHKFRLGWQTGNDYDIPGILTSLRNVSHIFSH